MATRAQIGVLQEDGELFPVLIYRHWDGYPQGVLPVLQPMVDYFLEKRGFYDPEYLLARILMWLGVLDPPGEVTGYGLTPYWMGMVEWVYIVDPNGKIRVHEMHDTPDEETPTLQGLLKNSVLHPQEMNRKWMGQAPEWAREQRRHIIHHLREKTDEPAR